MTDTEFTPNTTTPAEVASAVLNAIEAQPDVFDMNHWADLPETGRLAPEEAPPCGARLCAAAWVAHLTGWTLVSLLGEERGLAPVTALDAGGAEHATLASVYAERGKERRRIRDVAAKALALRPGETFWNVDAPTALKRLRDIAGH
ncbi:hypothetical protein P8605_02765 [Streptomyces sp. T-3]|nr:hypothetical protein [Streptomyces sp. T-3]